MQRNMNIQNKRLFAAGMILAAIGILIGTGCKKNKDFASSTPFKIVNFYPNSGNAGTLVTIEGAGFGTDLMQYKASIAGVSAEVISATGTALVVRMPQGAGSGGLSINFKGKDYEAGNYTYQKLSVRNVFPSNGPAGSQIRISGEGFSSLLQPATVLINGKQAIVVSASDTLIVAEVPKDAGTGAITVKVDGMESKGRNFTYQAIYSIKPLTGGKGTRVTIQGTGFEGLAAGNQVDFNGKTATVVEATEDKLVVQTPDGVTTGPLSVSINGQKTTGPTFTVVGLPVITVVTPLSGPKGLEMTISGSLFSTVLDENKVFINNVEVPVKSATDKALTLVLPGNTGSGIVRVVVNDQSTDGPQFKDQNLGITSVSPDNGLAGTSVTINGAGFSTNPSDNKVYFNGQLATVKTATETTLTLDAPPGVSTGDLKVNVNGLEALAPQPFRRAGVMTLAGGPSSSEFGRYMSALAIDGNDIVYVVDQTNNRVKKISPDGTVSVLQENGSDIVFDSPLGIVIDKSNNLYVSEPGQKRIRKITPSGQTSVYSSGLAFASMGMDDAGNIYAAISGFALGMYKVFIAGNYSKIQGPGWVFSKPAIDASGAMYYTDQNLNGGTGIAKTPAAGNTIYVWAGASYDNSYADGIAGNARFNNINGVSMYGPGDLLVADKSNFAVRKVNIATVEVSTLVKVAYGFADGTLSAAKFGSVDDVVADRAGNIYVLDAENRAIRKIFLK